MERDSKIKERRLFAERRITELVSTSLNQGLSVIRTLGSTYNITPPKFKLKPYKFGGF